MFVFYFPAWLGHLLGKKLWAMSPEALLGLSRLCAAFIPPIRPGDTDGDFVVQAFIYPEGLQTILMDIPTVFKSRPDSVFEA